LHQAFMHYVLAGSLYVAWTICFPGTSKSITSPVTELAPRSEQPLAAVLRDWMPFLLSAAITAGVAPLLFIQIVYQRQFYSANLLLFWRWMIVVPVLITAFYLLYLIKSSIMKSWPRTARGLIACVTAGCFVFVGFCWTANHLLGMSESKWPEIYISGQMPFVASTICFRMLIWIGGSFASMAAMTSWQLFYFQSRKTEFEVSSEVRRLALMSLGGMGIAALACLVSVAQSSPEIRQVLLSSGTSLYLLFVLLGLVMQGQAWWTQLGLKQLQSHLLIRISIGAALSLLGISFLREAVRTNIIDLTGQYQKHAEAAKMGGFAVFIIFTVIVTAVIVWCIVIVREGLKQTESTH
jgi:hypothetical protein